VLAETNLERCSLHRGVDPVVVSERSQRLPFAEDAAARAVHRIPVLAWQEADFRDAARDREDEFAILFGEGPIRKEVVPFLEPPE
jgi:hypothetical protein